MTRRSERKRHALAQVRQHLGEVAANTCTCDHPPCLMHPLPRPTKPRVIRKR
jgi:hypothetical protein